jgi:DNA-binding NarL/FixJ family response regulator
VRVSPEPPVIVVEGTITAFESVVSEVGRAGWDLGTGFGGAASGARAVRVGAVSTPAEAADALLAVLAGAGVVIHGLAPRETLDRLLDDLRHVRRVDLRRVEDKVLPELDEEARGILRILAEGRTLGDAAHALGLSRRTADRRLSEARRALGVERTVEAVAAARRLGWLR